MTQTTLLAGDTSSARGCAAPIMVSAGPSLASRCEVYLDEVCQAIGKNFVRLEPRHKARAYVWGLLGPATKKTGRQLAIAAGDVRPDGMQRLLATARWDSEVVQEHVRRIVAARASDADGVLVVQRQDFVKRGSGSAGIEVRYSPTSRRAENCQLGFFATYGSHDDDFIVDRRLYLSPSWLADGDRCARAGVPSPTGHHEPWELAHAMIAAARATGLCLRWVATTTPELTSPRLRQRLHDEGQPYVLPLPAAEVTAWLDHLPRPSAALSRAPARPADGSRSHDVIPPGAPCAGERWTCWPLRADVRQGMRLHLLLEHPPRAPGAPRGHLVHAPAGTPSDAVARVISRTRRARECLASARRDIGLASYEVRQWAGWYRHMTLASVAHYSLTCGIADLDTSNLLCPPPAVRAPAPDPWGGRLP